MADSMVTGRVPAQKKIAATRVLNKLGVSTSQAINQLFDYLIINEALPFPEKDQKRITREDMDEAREFICSMVRPNAFTNMSYDEMKRHKAQSMGYLLEQS